MQLGALEDIPEWENAIAIKNTRSGVREAVFGDESGVAVRFRVTPQIDFQFNGLDDATIDENAIKKVKNVEHCIIRPFFDRFTVWDQPIRPRDKVRFSRQYTAWKSGKEEKHFGTTLETWEYQLSESEVMTFKLLGCSMVHELAQLPDLQLEALNMPGAFQVRARARVYTSESMRKEGDVKLQERFDAQAKELQVLRDEFQQFNQLREAKERESEEKESKKARMLDSLVEKSAPRRGRPKKVQ